MNYCSCSRLCEGPLMMCLRAAMVTFKQNGLHRLGLLCEICSFPPLMKSCFYGLPVNRVLGWVYSKLLKQSCCFSSVSLHWTKKAEHCMKRANLFLLSLSSLVNTTKSANMVEHVFFYCGGYNLPHGLCFTVWLQLLFQ